MAPLPLDELIDRQVARSKELQDSDYSYSDAKDRMKALRDAIAGLRDLVLLKSPHSERPVINCHASFTGDEQFRAATSQVILNTLHEIALKAKGLTNL